LTFWPLKGLSSSFDKHFNSLPDCFKKLLEIYFQNIFLIKNNKQFEVIVYEQTVELKLVE